MNTQSVAYKVKAFGAGKLASSCWSSCCFCLPAQGSPNQPGSRRLPSSPGTFTFVGELRIPAGTAPFPVVLFVHGSGLIDRTLFGGYLPIMERMLGAGYAVFSWDKPGTGESTGQINEGRVYHQRAQIVLDAIEVMKKRPDIDHRQIGLWGISQGGYVMPSPSQTKDIAFMLCVSCAGVAGDDQLAYQLVPKRSVMESRRKRTIS